jgi:hypothetical protein
MITIQHDGDTWNIVSQGASRDGKVFCHLASTTKGSHQRNGFCPLQINDWIDHEAILSAAMLAEEAARNAYITAYYADRANSGLAALYRAA